MPNEAFVSNDFNALEVNLGIRCVTFEHNLDLVLLRGCKLMKLKPPILLYISYLHILGPFKLGACTVAQLVQSKDASVFLTYEFVYAPRSYNKAAHVLAAVGCSCPLESVLSWDGIPSCIVDVVDSDIAAPLS